jgi:hypothetical protein
VTRCDASVGRTLRLEDAQRLDSWTITSVLTSRCWIAQEHLLVGYTTTALHSDELTGSRASHSCPSRDCDDYKRPQRSKQRWRNETCGFVPDKSSTRNCEMRSQRSARPGSLGLNRIRRRQQHFVQAQKDDGQGTNSSFVFFQQGVGAGGGVSPSRSQIGPDGSWPGTRLLSGLSASAVEGREGRQRFRRNRCADRRL